MKLFLTRHGESTANRDGIIQGHADYPLSDLGREQATELAYRIKNKGLKFDKIFSSDLKRAAETTRIIAEIINDQNIEYTSLIREFDLGIYSGRKQSDLQTKGDDFLEEVWKDQTIKVPGGECVQDMVTRIEKFMKSLLQSSHSTVLVIAHGGVLFHVIHTMFDLYRPPEGAWFKNCSLNILEYKNGKWKLLVFNEKEF